MIVGLIRRFGIVRNRPVNIREMSNHNQNLVRDVRRSGDSTIVMLSGDIDLHRSPSLHEALVAVTNEQPRRLVLNMTDVPYMDSSGVGTLVDVFRRVAKYQGKLVLCGLTARVKGVFEVTKLDRFFTICDSPEQAESI